MKPASINPNPSVRVCEEELKDLFLNFCSFLCIVHNKKLNLPNIFLLLLKEDKVNKLYKDMADFDTDYEAFKSFLDYDSSLHKSKYIKKYLNATYKTPKKRGNKRRKKRV